MNKPQRTPEAITQILKKDIEARQLESHRVANLFLKYKKFLRQTYETTDFQQPALFLRRRSRKVEFYENITSGLWEFKHSDGSTRFLILTTSGINEYGFADKTFKAYDCDEDHPLPLPEDPLITTEQVNILIDKALNDVKEWKAKEIQATTGLVKTILIGAAALLGIYLLYKFLAPQQAPAVVDATKTTIQVLNTSVIK